MRCWPIAACSPATCAVGRCPIGDGGVCECACGCGVGGTGDCGIGDGCQLAPEPQPAPDGDPGTPMPAVAGLTAAHAWLGSPCAEAMSACAIATALGNRWFGSFAIAVRITDSIAGGRSGRSWRGGSGGSSTCLRRRSNSESALNGRRPVAHS
jgi:hypothetical protein